MLLTAILTALAVAPTVFADAVTTSAIRCTTSFGYTPLAPGMQVTTWLNTSTTTNYFDYTITTRNVVTVTPSASTLTDILTTTAVFEVTTTSTHELTTIPTPAGFLPLFAYDPNPTAISRAKRFDHQAHDHEMALAIFKRQTAANNTGGFSVDRDGSTSNIFRKYPQRVDCRIMFTINETVTSTVTGTPETTFAAGATALVMSTVTISTTTTVTAVAPRRTMYAACMGNNVVNSVPGMTGEDIVFNRVIYRPSEGFPLENELIVNTTSAENCCIACQNTAFCAGSFFVPSKQECHLRLTQAPSLALPAPRRSALPAPPYAYGNYTGNHYRRRAPTASGIIIMATGTSPAMPISTAAPSTCGKGSLSLYLGTVQGELNFPKEYALVFSNGRCGRFSVWPVPVNENLDTSLEDRKVKRLEVGAN